MKQFKILVTIIILAVACQPATDQSQIDEWKEEIREAEVAFSRMANEEGISLAFRAFAADEVALLRGGKLVIGKAALEEQYSSLERNPDVSLTWAPDFIDVSSSGDLAYTYGSYVFTRKDSVGNVSENTGVFHTVWKRQEDGSWKYVWD